MSEEAWKCPDCSARGRYEVSRVKHMMKYHQLGESKPMPKIRTIGYLHVSKSQLDAIEKEEEKEETNWFDKIIDFLFGWKL